jgi:hypothetical protein
MIRRLKRRLSKSTSCPDRSGAHEWDSDKAVVASSGLPFRVKVRPHRHMIPPCLTHSRAIRAVSAEEEAGTQMQFLL